MAESRENPVSHKKTRKNFNSTHIHRKRPSNKFFEGENILYVNSKTHLKAFIERCDKLASDNHEEIVIYCLGAAISKGILLALQVIENHVAYKIHTNTLTTTVVEEIVKWLGLTVFEIWINMIAFLIFTILLVLNYNPNAELYSNNWWLIFSPLFIGDALNTYFCIILFIRMILELSVRYSMLRLTWSATFLLTTFLFKYLLCKKLLGQLSLDYSEVFAPLYILLQLIAVRACQQEG